MENTTNGNEGHGNTFAGTQLGESTGAFLAGLNIFFSITASLGNALILSCFHKVTSIYPPSKLLYRSLVATDLCVGLISQPCSAIALIPGMANTNKNLFYYSKQLRNTTSYILCAVSFSTSTAISVDRLLALLLGLRYRQVVTLRRARGVMICVWFLPCVLAALSFSRWSSRVAQVGFVVLLLLCLLIAVFSYIKIYLLLRHHQRQVQCHAQQARPPNGGASPLNIARYKKTVSSIAWVQLALLVCYIPFILMGILFKAYGILPTANETGSTVFFITTTFVYLNSSLNPILYCWKIRDVKQAAKETIRQLNCCYASS